MMQTNQSNNETQRGNSAAVVATAYAGKTSSYLGPSLRIKGEITGNEDLKLDSEVEGLVSIGGFRLTMGPGAHLNGDIVAREALISGKVTGDISACDRIEIMKCASIEGDICTAKIMIEEGAYFKGGIEIGDNTAQIGTDLDSLLKGAKKPKRQ